MLIYSHQPKAKGLAICTSLIVITFLLLSGCQKTPALTSNEVVFKAPTGAEVFHLRSECAKFGEKIMDGNIIGPALYQDQVSHYNPKTNRCYVELDVQMADSAKAGD